MVTMSNTLIEQSQDPSEYKRVSQSEKLFTMHMQYGISPVIL